MLPVSHLCRHPLPHTGTLFCLLRLWIPVLSPPPDSEGMAPSPDQALTALTRSPPRPHGCPSDPAWVLHPHPKSFPLGMTSSPCVSSDNLATSTRCQPPPPTWTPITLVYLPVFVDPPHLIRFWLPPLGCSLWGPLLPSAWTLAPHLGWSPHKDTVLTPFGLWPPPNSGLQCHLPPDTQLSPLLCSTRKL